jgi:hypothetical protein
MSKSFSAACKRGRPGLALATLILLAAAGCSRQNEAPGAAARASTVVTPEMRVDAVPEEEPAVARSLWRAANEGARTVTGNLRVSLLGSRGGPVVFAFATGVTVRAQPVQVAPAADRSGVAGRSFAEILGGDARVLAHHYRVLDETVAATAPSGGLCGRERSTNMVVSEYVDDRGRWVFKIASFRGDGPPGVTGVDPQFCATYAFDAP